MPCGHADVVWQNVIWYKFILEQKLAALTDKTDIFLSTTSYELLQQWQACSRRKLQNLRHYVVLKWDEMNGVLGHFCAHIG